MSASLPRSILLTGATGFVGRALAARLVADGWCVRPATRRRGQLADAAVVGNIDGHTDWRAALDGVETVIHLAARVHVMRDAARDPLAEFRRVNVEGTLNLARQAAQAGARRFVFMSTLKVNGEATPATAPFTEDAAPAPQDAYAISKFEAEQGLLKLAETTEMTVVIIRPPLVYGPGVKGNFAAMASWLRRGLPLPLGAVANRRSLIALDNLVDFVALCADSEKSPRAANKVFLIADGEDVSTPELLRRVARAYDVKARLLSVPPVWLYAGARLLGKSALAERLLGSLTVDVSRARELLGWRPVSSMDEQLRKMANDAADA
jgi:nucleoside-diphosphate-sugar epimerase